MPEAPAPAVPRDLSVGTPANWFDLDLDPVTSVRSIRRLVEERVGAGEAHRESRQVLVDMLEDATRGARSRGAVLASILSDVIEDMPVAASLLVSRASDPSPVATPEGQVRAEAIAAVLSGGAAQATQSVSVVELRAGWAVRVRKPMSVEPKGLEGHPVPLESVQFFVLIPATTDLILLSFSTPNLDLADAMVELFDAIAGSLRWRW